MSSLKHARGAWSVLVLLAATSLGCDGPAATDASVPPDADLPLDPDLLMPCTSESCVVDPFARLADPYLPARRLPGRARLASSRQPEPPDGTGNDDYNNFVRIEGGDRVLMEATGPGLITRLWFTGRQPMGQIYEVLDRTILHMEIDGSEVVWVEGESGVSLATLTSGTLPGFPRPWVAGRDTASNAFLVNIPITFGESIRVWIDEPPGIETLFFYQIDWRQLHESYVVESFDGSLEEDQVAAIEAATELWVEHSVAAMASTEGEHTIAPGETAVIAVDEPTTVRALTVALSEGSLDALEGELVVDGVSAVTGPLARWTFASPPTVPHDTALTTVEEEAVTFRYPFPVQSAVELRLRNAGSTPITATVRFEHDPGAPEADLGALRVSCGVEQTPVEGQNITLLDIAGKRGHYAGQFLVVTSAEEGYGPGSWVLEGDHEIEVDGEHLLGTGLEDYFGGAFYYRRGAFALPLEGAPYRSAPDDPGYRVVSQYRHHFWDTINFEGTLRFDYESFQADSTFEYCAFWYEDI